MRLLLDTHVFLWFIRGNRMLSKSAQSKIVEAQEVYVSSASIWEIAIKVKLKKLDFKVEQVIEAIAESGFLELPVLAYHAAATTRLPIIHRDPFDLMLIAQAVTEPLTFLTADADLRQYSELVEII